jgi:hypothetical protein
VDYIACSYQNPQTPISKVGCSLFRLSAKKRAGGTEAHFLALKYANWSGMICIFNRIHERKCIAVTEDTIDPLFTLKSGPDRWRLQGDDGFRGRSISTDIGLP